MPVAAPSDRRFRRAQVSPARKRKWRPLWRTAARVAVGLAIAGFSTYYVAERVLSAEALTITRISVAGNSRMSRGEVLALLDGLQGTSMVTADLEEWRQKLIASPWVADAAMRRVFPGTVAVSIAEREPMGIGRIGDRLFLIDERGSVIDEFGPHYAEFDLPIISGLASSRGAAGIVDESRALLAGRLLSEVQRRPELAQRISEIDVSDVKDAAVILKGDTTVVRIGQDQFVERLRSYFDLVPTLRERVPNIDYVDLRFDERVYVKPHPEGRTPTRAKGNRDAR